MAEFPSPQAASGTLSPPAGAGLVVYALFALTAVLTLVHSGFLSPPLLSLIGVAGVIVAYVKRDEARGTWVASHLDWLIRTFWWSLLWLVIGAVLFVTLLGIPVALALWVGTSIWVLYRVTRGYLLYKDSKPIAGG
jgi:uncharacterized membrane protein